MDATPVPAGDRLRVDASELVGRVETGEVLLVCAYEDERKCRDLVEYGSISLDELEARLPALPQTKEIVFWCH